MSALFTPLELRALRAAVDQIIPADDYPGGWDAGVGDYLERLLTCEPRFVPVYQAGLRDLNAEARAAYGADFDELSARDQNVFIRRVCEGDIQGLRNVESEAFFALLLRQTMEGFYADPGNGGNKDAVSWRMVGFEAAS